MWIYFEIRNIWVLARYLGINTHTHTHTHTHKHIYVRKYMFLTNNIKSRSKHRYIYIYIKTHQEKVNPFWLFKHVEHAIMNNVYLCENFIKQDYLGRVLSNKIKR
jgi:hypothetical protein